MNEGPLSTDKVSAGTSDVTASKVGTHGLAHPGFRWWHEVSVLGLLILLLIVAELLVPGFLSFRSQLLLSRHLWEIAILSLAMTLVILTAGIDLSVGGIMGLSAVAFGVTFSATNHLVVSCASCLCVATICGAVNGALVSRWRLHPLIVTLATMAAFRGLAEGWSQGQSWSAFGAGSPGLREEVCLAFRIPELRFWCSVSLWESGSGNHQEVCGCMPSDSMRQPVGFQELLWTESDSGSLRSPDFSAASRPLC